MKGKKFRIGLICGSIVVMAGAVTAFAANGNPAAQNIPEDRNLIQVENGTARYSTDGGFTWEEGLPVDGTTQYSLDDGQTWTDGLPPEGSGEKSLIIHGNGTPPAPGEGESFMVQNRDGVVRYSADGGKTWSEEAPDDVQITEDGGKVTIQRSIQK